MHAIFSIQMVISFANQKGGTGKTTTLLTLATYQSKQDKKILVIDLDPQASSTNYLLKFDENQENNLNLDQIVYRILVDNLGVEPMHIEGTNIDLIPSSSLLSRAELELAMSPDSIDNSRVRRLKTVLDQIKGNYDYVFIDCPGSLGLLTMNGLCASDSVVVVTSIGRFELNALKNFLKELDTTVRSYNPSLEILGILPTMVDPYPITDQIIKKMMDDPKIAEKLFKIGTVRGIPKNNAIRNATNEALSIWDYSPLSPSGQAYMKLWEEMESRMNPV